jgi:hypothetical protein
MFFEYSLIVKYFSFFDFWVFPVYGLGNPLWVAKLLDDPLWVVAKRRDFVATHCGLPRSLTTHYGLPSQKGVLVKY